MRGAATFGLFAIAALAPAQWSVTVLHPAGKSESQVYYGSPSTQVGYIIQNGNFHASVWQGSAASWIDLNPQNVSISVATGVTGGLQAGYALMGNDYEASLWSGTSESRLSLHPAGTTASVIHGAGPTRQVGYTYTSGRYRAALWSGTAASWIDLDPPAAGGSTAMAVYEDDLMSSQVGTATVGGFDHAALWNGSAATWVDLNPDGIISSIAYGVYKGFQVGLTIDTGVEHAALWAGSANAWIDLHPAGADSSVAYGIYANIEVGYATFAGKNHAGIWRGSAESWTDLHAALPADYESSVARSISSDGVYDYVAGYGYNKTTLKTEALLWRRASIISDDFAFTLNKTVVAGQNSVMGTITPTTTVAFPRTYTTYDDSSLVTTPATVTVTAGAALKNFQITVLAVNSPINTTIYAKRGATVRSRPLTLAPLIPTALSFTPNPVIGGNPTQGRVVVNGVAGPSGRTIALFDNSTFATTPNSVVVPPGGTDASFTIQTLPVTSAKTVTVTARVSAGEKTGTFRINP